MIILSELANIFGASFFIFLFLVRAAQYQDGDLVTPILALQSVLAAFFIVMHKPVERISHPLNTLISWLCVLLPLAFDLKNVNTLYSLPGLILAVWSLVTLGFSFSIPPEDRGIVERGPYRFVRHPMYLGEILSLLGLCLAAENTWNWLALLLFVRLLMLRIAAEENVLSKYEPYRKSVRWRMLPGIW